MSIKTIKIDLINACNFSCNFCPYFSKVASVRSIKIKKLDVEMLKREPLVDAVRGFSGGGDARVNISGRGEATLHPEFRGIVGDISVFSSRIKLITNGYRLHTLEDAFLKKFDTVCISVHGWGEEHDAIVNKKGAFERAIKAASRTARITKTVIYSTLGKGIFGQGFERLLNFCRAHGLELNLSHDFLLRLDNEKDAGKIYHRLKELGNRYGNLRINPRLSEKEAVGYYTNERYVIDPHNCMHFDTSLDIMSNGDVITCADVKIGNIYTVEAKDMLKSPQYISFLDRINKMLGGGGLSNLKCDRCCYQNTHEKGRE